MSSEIEAPQVCRFGEFEVDFRSGQLRRNGTLLHLQPKALALLRALLERPGSVISRGELRAKLWGKDTFVEFDDGLNHAVKKLRQILGDTSEAPHFIETLPRHGYRFVAPVEFLSAQQVLTPVRDRSAIRQAATMSITFLVLAVAAAYGLFVYRSAPRHGQGERVMLAVLPLDNLSGDETLEYLSDGFTEELLTELARLNPAQLGVVARTSSARLKKTDKSVPEIGRELGVDYLVEGSVRYDGPRLRVTAQLIRVEDETHVWADAYERDSGSVLDVQKEISTQVGRALAIQLLQARPGGSTAPHRPAPGAREALLLGRYYLSRRSGDDFAKAKNAFEKALTLDPDYPAAHAGLAQAYILLANYGVLPPGEGKPKAKALALKALELEPSLVDARVTLAGILTEFEWNFTAAETEFTRAIRDNPNNALAHHWYSVHLSALGRQDEAIEQMKLTCQLDPLSLGAMADLGRAYYFARRHDEAMAQYRRALEMDRNYSNAHTLLGLALLEQKQYAAAIGELEAGIAGSPGTRSIYLPYAHAVAENTGKARALLEDLLRAYDKAPFLGVGIALAYVALGDPDQAFAWLEREYRARSAVIFMLKAHPYWDPIRNDPRYADLLRRAGFPSDAMGRTHASLRSKSSSARSRTS